MNFLLDYFLRFGRLVKFSHSVFALPFALSMVVVVSREQSISFAQLTLIVLSLIFARTAAMGANRVLDRKIDSQNPRTKSRELVTGEVSIREAIVLTVAATGGFLLSAALLGLHCLVMTPLVLFVLFGYSYTKRFTNYSHLVLGLALALAPGGAWYALTADFAVIPLPLMAAVLFWVCGFDILYSCQDEEYDRKMGLYSIPKRFGKPIAFQIAAACHTVSVIFLVVFGALADLHIIYYGTVLVFGVLLLGQYFLIRPHDLSKIDIAFFNRNGFASIVFFLGVVLDVAVFSTSLRLSF